MKRKKTDITVYRRLENSFHFSKFTNVWETKPSKHFTSVEADKFWRKKMRVSWSVALCMCVCVRASEREREWERAHQYCYHQHKYIQFFLQAVLLLFVFTCSMFIKIIEFFLFVNAFQEMSSLWFHIFVQYCMLIYTLLLPSFSLSHIHKNTFRFIIPTKHRTHNEPHAKKWTIKYRP